MALSPRALRDPHLPDRLRDLPLPPHAPRAPAVFGVQGDSFHFVELSPDDHLRVLGALYIDIDVQM